MRMFNILSAAALVLDEVEIVEEPAILSEETMQALTFEIIPKVISDSGIRATMPDDDARAYFVWRMARFHGGKDLSMPVKAEMLIRHEPREVRDFLDSLASLLAEQIFGTSTAAVASWMGAV